MEIDLELLSTTLQSPDSSQFDIVISSGTHSKRASQEKIVTDLEEFFAEPSSKSRLNLVYIASHAFVDKNGTLRILPETFNSNRPLSTSIPITFIAECLLHCPEDSLVLILDCCYAEVASWEILRNQQRPFQIRSTESKSYCIVASCRNDETARDGGFTPVFVDALKTLEPEFGEKEGVTVERIFDYTAGRVVDRYGQTPKLWLSREFTIPLGRRYGGIRALRSAVKALYDYLDNHLLLDPPEPNSYNLDFVEQRETIAGLKNRIGIRVFDNASAEEPIEEVVNSLTKAVHNDVIDNGIIIVTDATNLERLSTNRIAVRSLIEMRRDLLALIKYLEKCVQNYENAPENTPNSIYRKGHYISLSAYRFQLYVHEDYLNQLCQTLDLPKVKKFLNHSECSMVICSPEKIYSLQQYCYQLYQMAFNLDCLDISPHSKLLKLNFIKQQLKEEIVKKFILALAEAKDLKSKKPLIRRTSIAIF